MGRPVGHATSAAEVGTSPSAQSSSVAVQATSLPSNARGFSSGYLLGRGASGLSHRDVLQG